MKRAMPGSWDPKVYEARAQQWREAAAALAPGQMREAYLVLAEGYEKLAKLIALEKGTVEHLSAGGG
jgi:hypothetical protein